MANQIRSFVGLTLLLAAISASAQTTHTIEVTRPFPYILPRTVVSALKAKAGCPGNLAGVPLHLVSHYLFIVPVSVNRSGPFNFVLDTGTQTTTIDPSLAAELHLHTKGAPEVEGIGFQATASSAQLDLLEAGSHAVANQKVLVFSLRNLESIDLHVSGVLGEDFLEHFDMLIDNAHNLLCLDDSAAMRADMKGMHISLVMPVQAADGGALSNSLIVEARLSDGIRPVRLWLDSGTNVPYLYNPSEYLARRATQVGVQQGVGGDGAQRAYVALPIQDMKIGSLRLSKMTFFTAVDAQKNPPITEFDGVLTTWLFRRIFISHTEHYAVLEPR